MLCEILMNVYIWSHSTDEYDYEELIEYLKFCIEFISEFTSGDYVYFMENVEEPKSHHKLSYWIKNQNWL